MIVDPVIAGIVLTAMVGLQAWTLAAVVDLKIKLAAIVEHCKLCDPKYKI